MANERTNSICDATDLEFELMKARFGQHIVFWPELHQQLIDKIRKERAMKRDPDPNTRH